MTPEQRAALIARLQKFWAAHGTDSGPDAPTVGDMVAHIDQLLAQARADALADAAKVCDERAKWLLENGHIALAEQSDTLAAAIRKLGEKRE